MFLCRSFGVQQERLNVRGYRYYAAKQAANEYSKTGFYGYGLRQCHRG